MKTEQQTRIELIGNQLAEAQTSYQGHQFSDYVLLGKNGKPLAVVEAKKSSKDAALGFKAMRFEKDVLENASVLFVDEKNQEGPGPVMLDFKDKVKDGEMVEFSPQGIRGVFSPGEINERLTLTEFLAA